MAAGVLAVYVATAWFVAGLGVAGLWHACKTGWRRRAIRRAGSSWLQTDGGFVLLEILVAVVILGLVAVPMSNFLVTTIRTTAAAERRMERVGMAQVAAGIATRAVVADECDGDGYEAAVTARVDPGRLQVAISPDCDGTPTVLTVTVTDSAGDATEMVVARVCFEDGSCGTS